MTPSERKALNRAINVNKELYHTKSAKELRNEFITTIINGNPRFNCKLTFTK
jgi:hypothetical protein